MLIEFAVRNFRSFKDLNTLSMVAANTKARDDAVNANNTIRVDEKLSLLTSVAVYGANASGKSNLVKAIALMRQLVMSSAKETQADEPTGVEPFRLSSATEKQPTFFQAVFLVNGAQYRYGFEVNVKRIVSEWLFSVPSTKEARLFVREGNDITISPKYFREGKGLQGKTRSNALFLSVVAQFNGEISVAIQRWFRALGIVSGLDDTSYRNYTIKQVMKGKHKDEIINLVKSLDIDIDDIEGMPLDESRLRFDPGFPEELRPWLLKSVQDKKVLTAQTKHRKLNAKGQEVGSVVFEMDGNESHGTQKAFYLAGPIIDVISGGRLLVIDEMEARLHPLVTRQLIRLFNSIETNPKRAQLMVTTHDTNLLSKDLFRRDQIWFVEKDRACASHLYSLAEIKVRNDASFEEDYLRGKYGAIPFLGGIQKIAVSDVGGNHEEE